jgi:uncharacterized OB-fold protein
MSAAAPPARSEDALAGLRFELPTEPLPFLEPAQNPETDFYWRSENDGVLRLLKCADCGYITHPVGPVCGNCLSRNLAPQPLSGRGTVYAWSVNVQPFIPGIPPYCIGLVQIEEQADVRLTTQLVDVALEDIRVDLPVEVVFVVGAGGVKVPFFRPVSA